MARLEKKTEKCSVMTNYLDITVRWTDTDIIHRDVRVETALLANDVDPHFRQDADGMSIIEYALVSSDESVLHKFADSPHTNFNARVKQLDKLKGSRTLLEVYMNSRHRENLDRALCMKIYRRMSPPFHPLSHLLTRAIQQHCFDIAKSLIVDHQAFLGLHLFDWCIMTQHPATLELAFLLIVYGYRDIADSTTMDGHRGKQKALARWPDDSTTMDGHRDSALCLAAMHRNCEMFDLLFPLGGLTLWELNKIKYVRSFRIVVRLLETYDIRELYADIACKRVEGPMAAVFAPVVAHVAYKPAVEVAMGYDFDQPQVHTATLSWSMFKNDMFTPNLQARLVVALLRQGAKLHESMRVNPHLLHALRPWRPEDSFVLYSDAHAMVAKSIIIVVAVEPSVFVPLEMLHRIIQFIPRVVQMP